MRQIHVLSPYAVQLDHEPHPKDVATQAARLLAEGQIEPAELALCGDGRLHVHPQAWVYTAAQIAAARLLDWPNILVTY